MVATAAKGDIGPWKQNELGVRGGLHPPLLGREAADCRMDPGRRLAGHHGASARPRIDLHQVPIAVEQAGRRVEQVNERGKLSGELKRRQHAEGNLLVSRTKAGPPLLFDQSEMNAADLARGMLGESELAEFGRSHEVFGRDANCSRTHVITSSTPSLLTEADQQERPLAPHLQAVAPHDVQVGADVRRQVDLVDDQQVAVADARTSLAGNLVALGHVDDEDETVGQLAREDRGEVVAAGLDDDQLEVREAAARNWRSALRLPLASSRMAVCGQPPVWTPTIRSSGSTSRRERNSASSWV